MNKQNIYPFKASDGKTGLVSKSGKIVLSPKIKEYYLENNTLSIVGKKQITVYDLTNEEGTPIELSGDEYWCADQGIYDGMLRVESLRERKKGFVNARGEVVIPCSLSDASRFSEGLCAAKKEYDGLWGYIYKDGNEALPFKYEEAKDFKNGNAIVKINGKWGTIDNNGNEVISAQYDVLLDKATDIQSQKNNPTFIALVGLLLAKQNGKWGVIDIQGNTVIPFEYDMIYYSRKFVKDDYLVVVRGEYQGAFAFDGKEYLPCKYSTLDTVRRNGGMPGYNALPVPEFADLKGWVVKSDKGCGVVVEGKEYIPCKYEKIQYLGEKLFAFKQSSKYGIIKDGNEVAPAIYDDVDSIKDGMCRVKKGDSFCYIDINGKEVINASTPECDSLDVKHGCFVIVKDGNGLYGLNNVNGEVVAPCEYNVIKSTFDGFDTEKDGKYGHLGKTGEVVLPAEYDEIAYIPIPHDIIVAKQSRKWLVFDAVGNPLAAPKAKKAKK